MKRTPRKHVVMIGGGEWAIIVKAGQRDFEGRTIYHYRIENWNTRKVLCKGDDLKSGCQGGTAKEGMESLLSFLGAAAESYDYTQRGGKSDNDDIFPIPVMEWCYQYSDELSMLACEMEESPK